jgi:lipoate-protein ligase B
MPYELIDLGLIDFAYARQRQKEIFLSVRDGRLGATVIFCQHYPVITLGSQASRENLLVGEKDLKDKGIQVYKIERGGDVTYHGPGQLIVWPIIDLGLFKKDIHLFLRYLEEITIDLLSDFGIRGQRQAGFTGVWVNKRKIASIGIAIKNWISFHGLSVNIKEEDLANFKFIRPCGMDIEMTSLERELGRQIEIGNVKTNLMQKFSYSLNAQAESLSNT